MLDFYVKTGIRFSLRDKRLFEITEVEITRIDCTFVSPSADSRAVVSYWQRHVHEVLVYRLKSLSLPRKSVVKLTERPDMTIAVYRGRKTTTQQQF